MKTFEEFINEGASFEGCASLNESFNSSYLQDICNQVTNNISYEYDENTKEFKFKKIKNKYSNFAKVMIDGVNWNKIKDEDFTEITPKEVAKMIREYKKDESFKMKFLILGMRGNEVIEAVWSGKVKKKGQYGFFPGSMLKVVRNTQKSYTYKRDENSYLLNRIDGPDYEASGDMPFEINSSSLFKQTSTAKVDKWLYIDLTNFMRAGIQAERAEAKKGVIYMDEKSMNQYLKENQRKYEDLLQEMHKNDDPNKIIQSIQDSIANILDITREILKPENIYYVSPWKVDEVYRCMSHYGTYMERLVRGYQESERGRRNAAKWNEEHPDKPSKRSGLWDDERMQKEAIKDIRDEIKDAEKNAKKLMKELEEAKASGEENI